MINRRSIATVLGIILLIAAGKNTHAGIGPENVIVVVNADSLVSRTIANHYIQARDIPSGNVIMLTDVPDGLHISLADFRAKILTPILDTLNARGLAAQSRVIAYSADFPTAVNISEHQKKIVNPQIKKIQAGAASINGATFFYRFMLADQHEYLNPGSNLYARGKFDRNFMNPFNGDHQEKFNSAAKEFAEERFDTAAKSFSELFAEFPSLSPLALRAAEAYAKSGDEQQAIALLKAAILSGWWSARYLEENEALQKLLSDPVLSKTLPLMSTAPIAVQGSVGFANHRGYTASGHAVPIDKGGIPYLLSCCLAVVHERGSTVDQAIAVLERAAQADNSFPRGDFRFAGNADVRAQTRFPNVADALVYLQESGHKTEVFRSNLPTTAGDVAGLMVGFATVDLSSRKWRLVPGAIAENLTSFGGAYHISGHTKITDFLHAGAAMSSGTVAEPYALQFKFPLPMMYGYYADGVSAIEAFYLSVASPYQLLMVGDPICQPFARAPAAWIDISLSDQKANRVVISTQPIDLKQPKTPTREIELYVGGRLIQQTPPATKINFNLPEGASGVIDLRAALIGFDATEPRISFSADLDLQGPLATPQATVTQHRQANSAEMKFKLQCKQAESIELLHLNEAVGMIDGAAGELTIDTAPLGSGPLRFRARAHFGDKIVLGMPLVAQPQ